jgi:hypothetical protein
MIAAGSSRVRLQSTVLGIVCITNMVSVARALSAENGFNVNCTACRIGEWAGVIAGYQGSGRPVVLVNADPVIIGGCRSSFDSLSDTYSPRCSRLFLPRSGAARLCSLNPGAPPSTRRSSPFREAAQARLRIDFCGPRCAPSGTIGRSNIFLGTPQDRESYVR